MLFNELEHYGVLLVALQCYNKVDSSLAPVDCGVPQYRMIDPIVFILFMNDIVKSSSSAHSVLNADDSSLFLQHNCVNRLTHRTNMVLMKVMK